MTSKAERRAAVERVAAYHESCLAELLAYVAAALEQHRAGVIDVYEVDETLHQYHRAARELWKFCWAGGSGTHIEFVDSTIRRNQLDGPPDHWWRRGAPRSR